MPTLQQVINGQVNGSKRSRATKASNVDESSTEKEQAVSHTAQAVTRKAKAAPKAKAAKTVETPQWIGQVFELAKASDSAKLQIGAIVYGLVHDGGHKLEKIAAALKKADALKVSQFSLNKHMLSKYSRVYEVSTRGIKHGRNEVSADEVMSLGIDLAYKLCTAYDSKRVQNVRTIKAAIKAFNQGNKKLINELVNTSKAPSKSGDKKITVDGAIHDRIHKLASKAGMSVSELLDTLISDAEGLLAESE